MAVSSLSLCIIIDGNVELKESKEQVKCYDKYSNEIVGALCYEYSYDRIYTSEKEEIKYYILIILCFTSIIYLAMYNLFSYI